jgi:hypothetical protein
MAAIEVKVPDDWTPGQILATRQLLQHALLTACPVIVFVRKDVTPEQLEGIYDRVEAIIREADLQAT